MTYLSATCRTATMLARLPYPRDFSSPRANCGSDPALYSETRGDDRHAGPAGIPCVHSAGRVVLHPRDQYRVDPSWLDGVLGDMIARAPK